MPLDENNDLLNTAKDHFTKGHYKLAEPLLMELMGDSSPKADVPYMLATIAFDRGQLKKAIQLFKQSLQITPDFTDAAVGLSIILNDLGRYDEAKKIFDEAYASMKKRQSKGQKDMSLNDKLASKHAELGDLYFLNARYEEALEQFAKAKRLAPDTKAYAQKHEECLLKTDQSSSDVADALEKSLQEKFFRDLNF